VRFRCRDAGKLKRRGGLLQSHSLLSKTKYIRLDWDRLGAQPHLVTAGKATESHATLAEGCRESRAEEVTDPPFEGKSACHVIKVFRRKEAAARKQQSLRPLAGGPSEVTSSPDTASSETERFKSATAIFHGRHRPSSAKCPHSVATRQRVVTPKVI
jgi:hypothetical protein